MRLALSIPILIIAASGCGTMTCLEVSRSDPSAEPIFGGVRTDINCIVGAKTKADDGAYGLFESRITGSEARLYGVIDLPLSLAADILMLPYAVVWMIQHRPLPQKQASDAGVAKPTEPLSAGGS